MIGSGVADGCVVVLVGGPVKAGCGERVIVPAVHGRAPRAAAQPHNEASPRRAWEGPVGSRGDPIRARHATLLEAFRRRLSPFSSMRWAV